MGLLKYAIDYWTAKPSITGSIFLAGIYFLATQPATKELFLALEKI